MLRIDHVKLYTIDKPFFMKNVIDQLNYSTTLLNSHLKVNNPLEYYHNLIDLTTETFKYSIELFLIGIFDDTIK